MRVAQAPINTVTPERWLGFVALLGEAIVRCVLFSMNQHSVAMAVPEGAKHCHDSCLGSNLNSGQGVGGVSGG
ncbi:hypothetical protein C7S18_03095 [Ahniella affigens]|uniref:Uncharacterized protein n=1 Tax=Ahniella affigens TaxID=2021234 RepID=A0A2P1PN33_9GAMM|nr:hypothetical protein C7S18_03095 [Ahniella affigens]